MSREVRQKRGNGQDEQRICQALHIGQAGDACEHLGQAVGEDGGRGGIAARGVLAPHEADGAQRDDCQQTLDEHAAVGDGLRSGLGIQLLGGSAGAHEGVEAGDGAAGDGDEQRREQEARSGGLVRNGLAGLVDEGLARGGIERGVRGDGKPVNAGICRFVAARLRDAPTMPMTASKIMPYSR